MGLERSGVKKLGGGNGLTPAARLFQTYVIVIVCGLTFVSNHWHNTAVTWTFTGLGVARPGV